MGKLKLGLSLPQRSILCVYLGQDVVSVFVDRVQPRDLLFHLLHLLIWVSIWLWRAVLLQLLYKLVKLQDLLILLLNLVLLLLHLEFHVLVLLLRFLKLFLNILEPSIFLLQRVHAGIVSCSASDLLNFVQFPINYALPQVLVVCLCFVRHRRLADNLVIGLSNFLLHQLVGGAVKSNDIDRPEQWNGSEPGVLSYLVNDQPLVWINLEQL